MGVHSYVVPSLLLTNLTWFRLPVKMSDFALSCFIEVLAKTYNEENNASQTAKCSKGRM